ncbi:hypothetical protein ACFL35_01615 [Candidatus Riflebacteria bacterium]
MEPEKNEQLQGIIDVLHEIKEVLKENQKPEILELDDICSLIEVSKDTFLNKMLDRIPHRKVEEKYFFTRSAVLNYINSGPEGRVEQTRTDSRSVTSSTNMDTTNAAIAVQNFLNNSKQALVDFINSGPEMLETDDPPKSRASREEEKRIEKKQALDEFMTRERGRDSKESSRVKEEREDDCVSRLIRALDRDEAREAIQKGHLKFNGAEDVFQKEQWDTLPFSRWQRVCAGKLVTFITRSDNIDACIEDTVMFIKTICLEMKFLVFFIMVPQDEWEKAWADSKDTFSKLQKERGMQLKIVHSKGKLFSFHLHGNQKSR